MAKGKVRIINDLKETIIESNLRRYNNYYFECLFCLKKKENERIREHFTGSIEKQIFKCRKREEIKN